MRNNLLTWLIGILIVTILALYVDFSNQIGICDSTPGGGSFCRDTTVRTGLDLQGGLEIVLQALPRSPDQPVTSDQLEAARNIIEDRANGTGANEPVVQTAEGNRILVELPGLNDLQQATNIIKQTAFLEIVDGGSNPPSEGTYITTTLGPPLSEQLNIGTSTSSGTSTTTGSSLNGTGTVTSTSTVSGTTGTTASTPVPVATAAVSQPDKTWQTIITGDDIDGSKVAVTFDTANNPQVAFTLKGSGPQKFSDFTAANVNKYMPIILDKKVINVPVIQSAIPAGSGVINHMSLQDAQTLALQLKYGSLPVSLVPLETRQIAATLGQDAIYRSLIAGIVGLGLVALFMITYYRLPGVLASVALLIFASVTFAIFKLVPVTLTLAGIAGFILTIGMAVDANVLIFARLKDELRSGKTLAAAVEAGFDHAWPSIRDSNISTLITCGILFWFGSTFGGASIIKGFALTLAIGVIVSLFTAVTVSRTFLRAVVPTALSRNRWAFFLEDPKRTGATTPAPTGTIEG